MAPLYFHVFYPKIWPLKRIGQRYKKNFGSSTRGECKYTCPLENSKVNNWCLMGQHHIYVTSKYGDFGVFFFPARVLTKWVDLKFEILIIIVMMIMIMKIRTIIIMAIIIIIIIIIIMIISLLSSPNFNILFFV